MACGTPVIAFQRGAAPEVVKHGVSGFVVNTMDEMVAAVGQVHQIDPRCCREHVEDNFDVPMMVDRDILSFGLTSGCLGARAAREAGVSLWEMMDYLSKAKIPAQTTSMTCSTTWRRLNAGMVLDRRTSKR